MSARRRTLLCLITTEGTTVTTIGRIAISIVGASRPRIPTIGGASVSVEPSACRFVGPVKAGGVDVGEVSTMILACLGIQDTMPRSPERAGTNCPGVPPQLCLVEVLLRPALNKISDASCIGVHVFIGGAFVPLPRRSL